MEKTLGMMQIKKLTKWLIRVAEIHGNGTSMVAGRGVFKAITDPEKNSGSWVFPWHENARKMLKKWIETATYRKEMKNKVMNSANMDNAWKKVEDETNRVLKKWDDVPTEKKMEMMLHRRLELAKVIDTQKMHQRIDAHRKSPNRVLSDEILDNLDEPAIRGHTLQLMTAIKKEIEIIASKMNTDQARREFAKLAYKQAADDKVSGDGLRKSNKMKRAAFRQRINMLEREINSLS